jgi:hypothetical protein
MPYEDIDPKFFPIRPLKGMIRNNSPSLLQTGEFWTISNAYPLQEGIRKRDGYSYYAGGNQIAALDRPILGIVPGWQTDGTQFACALTSRYLYTISGYAAPTVVHWTYSTGKIGVSSTTVTGYGSDWDATANYLFANDYIVIDADESGDGPEEILISSITDHNTLTLDSAPSGTYSPTEYMEYGNCEDTNSPTLDGGTTGLANGTWARSAAVIKGGTYSWLLTKTSAADGGDADNYLTDNVLTDDMHGLTADTTYYVSFWMYSDVGTATNAKVVFQEYYSAAWHDTYEWNISSASTWESKTQEITLNAATTAVTVLIQIASAEEQSKVLYIDDVSVLENGVDYSIRRRFNVESSYLLDSTVCDNKVVICDHKRPLYSFDGSSFTIYDADVTYAPACVCFFADRLWIGNTVESGLYYKQRIRWSSLTDHTSFGALDFIDLPYGPGDLLRLVPMGSYLMAYFKDAVFLGRRSNIVSQPYVFTPVETGGIGLAGPRGVCSILNGNFFIGQDDVYMLSGEGLAKAKCPVAKTMIENCSNFDRVYVVPDPLRNRILFGMPESGTYISKIWMFNYRTGFWAYEDVSCTSLSNPLLDLGLTWDDLSGVISADNWDTGMDDFTTWDSIAGSTNSKTIYRTETGYIYQLSPNSGDDVSGSFTVTLVTGEIDLNAPFMDKTFSRLHIKLRERPASNLSFVVSYSIDGENSWTSLGAITISTSDREGKLDFLATGSAIKFKITESSTAIPYTISELDMKVRMRGAEVEFP